MMTPYDRLVEEAAEQMIDEGQVDLVLLSDVAAEGFEIATFLSDTNKRANALQKESA